MRRRCEGGTGLFASLAARPSSVLLLLLLAWLPARDGAADVALRWQDGEGAAAPLLARYLADSQIVADLIGLVSANFAFEPALVIAVGASSGPEFDPVGNAIRLPHAYLERALRVQAALIEAQEPSVEGEEALAVRRALGVVEYTLFHLLGHALLGHLPLDRALDDPAGPGTAADTAAVTLASWIMLAHRPDGAERWMRDVDAFERASGWSGEGAGEDYWHRHPLTSAARRELDCLALGRGGGHDGGMRAGGRREDGAARARRDACRARFEALDAGARTALDALLLADAPLRLGAGPEPGRRGR